MIVIETSTRVNRLSNTFYSYRKLTVHTQAKDNGFSYFVLIQTVLYFFSKAFIKRSGNIKPFLHMYPFQHIEEKCFRKTLWKKLKLLKMSNFTFFHNVFYAISILKSFNSHVSVVVCSFFDFGTVSKWCIKEWVKERK